MLIEGTLRRPEVTANTAARYVLAGFGAELQILVVHELVSRGRIFERYLLQIERQGYGRYTPLDAHDVAYEALPRSVEYLLHADLFDTVTLYDMTGEQLASATRDDPAAGAQLMERLQQERLKQPASRELLAQVGRYAEAAARMQKPRMAADVESLRKDLIGRE